MLELLLLQGSSSRIVPAELGANSLSSSWYKESESEMYIVLVGVKLAAESNERTRASSEEALDDGDEGVEKLQMLLSLSVLEDGDSKGAPNPCSRSDSEDPREVEGACREEEREFERGGDCDVKRVKTS